MVNGNTSPDLMDLVMLLFMTMEINYPSAIKEILSSLRDLGFNASVELSEQQFVDIFLLVTWEA
jgi:hypothetical protein